MATCHLLTYQDFAGLLVVELLHASELVLKVVRLWHVPQLAVLHPDCPACSKKGNKPQRTNQNAPINDLTPRRK